MLAQEVGYILVTFLDRDTEGCEPGARPRRTQPLSTLCVPRLHVRTVRQQDLHHGRIAVAGREVEGRIVRFMAHAARKEDLTPYHGVDACPLLEAGHHGLLIRLVDRIEELKVDFPQIRYRWPRGCYLCSRLNSDYRLNQRPEDNHRYRYHQLKERVTSPDA
jgi:hypothetical protein